MNDIPIKNDLNQITISNSGKSSNSSVMTDILYTREQQTKFFENLHQLLWSEAGLNPEKAMDHLMFFFAYRLIEVQADSLNLPQECRWSYIASIKDENRLYDAIRNGIGHFRRNPVTKPFFFPKHDIDRAMTLERIVKEINKLDVAYLQNSDVLGDIFEYMLGRGMSTMADDGQYFTNRQICKLAFDLCFAVKQTIRRPDGSLCTFADFFCGTGGFPASFVKGCKSLDPTINWSSNVNSIYCLDKDMRSVTTTMLNLLILTGVPPSASTIQMGDSFRDRINIVPDGFDGHFPNVQMDYILTNPPYGGDKTKGEDFRFKYCRTDKSTKQKEYFVNQEIRSIGVEDDDKVSAGVQLMMATLSPGGVAAIVLPQGFFFGTSNKAIELRRKLSEEYRIHFVVDIESGAFANTGTKTSMIVFQKGVGPTNTVQFINMDRQSLINASLEDLRNKRYSLNYKQYIQQEVQQIEGFQWVKLGDILSKKKYPKHPTSHGSKNGTYRFHTGAESNILYVDNPDIIDLIILINRTNGSGKCHIFLDRNCSAATQTIILNCDDENTTKYLYYYLSGNIRILENGYNGCNHKNITVEYVHDLTIPLPSIERQKEIVRAIDTWAEFARREEELLKMLEWLIMFEVKEMGRGCDLVRLGDILTRDGSGKTNSTSASNTGEYPFYGCTAEVPTGSHNNYDFDGDEYLLFAKSGGNSKTIFGDNLGIGKFHYITGKSAGNIAINKFILKNQGNCNLKFIYYLLKSMLYDIQRLAQYTTGNGNININLMLETIQIPLPSIEKQQSLQSLFDEVKHKHDKIAEYKSKMQEAIRQHIPGANGDAEITTNTTYVQPSPQITNAPVATKTRSIKKESDDMNTWTVKKLKERCMELSIKPSNKKKGELIAAIQAVENNNIQQSPSISNMVPQSLPMTINNVPESPSQQVLPVTVNTVPQSPFPVSNVLLQVGEDDMNKWTVKKLRDRCVELGIKGCSKKKKEELIAIIRENSGQNVPAPQVRVQAIPQMPAITSDINKPLTPSSPIQLTVPQIRVQALPQMPIMTLNINKPTTPSLPIQLTVPQPTPLFA